jgi:hypothetical protein
MSVTKKLCLRATFDLNEQPRRGDETAIVLLIEVGWLWQKVLGTTVCFYPCASEDVKEGVSIALGPFRMALLPDRRVPRKPRIEGEGKGHNMEPHGQSPWSSA